jgi:hypothetical protein
MHAVYAPPHPSFAHSKIIRWRGQISNLFITQPSSRPNSAQTVQAKSVAGMYRRCSAPSILMNPYTSYCGSEQDMPPGSNSKCNEQRYILGH